MAHTRKCPQCGALVAGTRSVCPRCETGMETPKQWDDMKQSRSVREEKRHAANVRMRNSGAGLFIMGILLLSRGIDDKANTLGCAGDNEALTSNVHASVHLDIPFPSPPTISCSAPIEECDWRRRQAHHPGW